MAKPNQATLSKENQIHHKMRPSSTFMHWILKLNHRTLMFYVVLVNDYGIIRQSSLFIFSCWRMPIHCAIQFCWKSKTCAVNTTS